jgi:hypothetical protein
MLTRIASLISLTAATSGSGASAARRSRRRTTSCPAAFNIRPDAYARKFGARTAREIVRDAVLRLSYTAHDLADFARDMGHVDKKTGEALPPFKWDEEERAHLRARLDALYFLLYGITDRDDVRYILDTFPIVKRDDERAFGGRYRTAELILAYMNALEAGDPDAKVAI